MFIFFLFKQKTAYEMRISDWSSDVCSSDLRQPHLCGGRESEREPEELHLGGRIPKPVHDDLSPGHGASLGQRGWDQLRAVFPGAAEQPRRIQIGRASCRERVCQYVSISVVAVSLKKNIHIHTVNYEC